MSKPVEPTKFVEYGTMFKLEPLILSTPRQLQCVNCGHKVSMSIYTVASTKFDRVCDKCAMTAAGYWTGRSHRKVVIDDAPREEEEGNSSGADEKVSGD